MNVRYSPLLVAVIIGWILSVCFHEFAHALIAYWGGDRTVRQKGYLSLNPIAYIHPIYTILLPCLILWMGGMPLPGAAVKIETHRLKNAWWKSAVSAAGPLSNILLLLILAVVLHPRTGLVDPNAVEQPTWVLFLGAMATLQAMAVLFNLIPIPPLDGFGILEPFMPAETRIKLSAPNVSLGGLFILFFVMFRVAPIRHFFWNCVAQLLLVMGLPYEATWRCYNIVFFGHSQ